MYTIRIVEKSGAPLEEFCSYEHIEDAVEVFDDIRNDYYKVELIRNNRIRIMGQINHDLAD